jgi:23S rRNA pseudouridine1911/1915/1917 synthase
VRLLETDVAVVLDKPAGVSMATSSREEKSAARAVARLLEACGVEPDPRLRLVHRLDVGTTGVVVLARGDAAHRALSRAFQSGGARKTYRALAWGHPVPARGVCDDPLGRDPKDGRKMRVRRDAAGGKAVTRSMKSAVTGSMKRAVTGSMKRAVTRYETLARLPSVADLRLFPETGRTHQIRVHLAAKGHPIVGDDLYGGATRWRGVRDPVRRRALQAARPLLHAERLEIPELSLAVEAPLPADYRAVLDALASDA